MYTGLKKKKSNPILKHIPRLTNPTFRTKQRFNPGWCNEPLQCFICEITNSYDIMRLEDQQKQNKNAKEKILHSQ